MWIDHYTSTCNVIPSHRTTNPYGTKINIRLELGSNPNSNNLYAVAL